MADIAMKLSDASRQGSTALDTAQFVASMFIGSTLIGCTVSGSAQGS